MTPFILAAALTLLSATAAQSATLDWDRNAEPDMKDYQVWACFTPSCVVIKNAASQFGAPIPQSPSGVRPSSVIDTTGKEGAFAVSARDLSLNESGLSVAVPFDKVAPKTPTGPALQ